MKAGTGSLACKTLLKALRAELGLPGRGSLRGAEGPRTESFRLRSALGPAQARPNVVAHLNKDALGLGQ